MTRDVANVEQVSPVCSIGTSGKLVCPIVVRSGISSESIAVYYSKGGH
jgi:hypothetical protein